MTAVRDRLRLSDPAHTAHQITAFIKRTFTEQGRHTAVIAVSGGIDSGTSVTLASRALDPDNVLAVMLPHGQQSTADAQAVLDQNNIPASNRFVIDVKPMVDEFAQRLSGDSYRRGNIAARCRMIVLYDTALAHRALVCGTENKSEYRLGYFTRYGDEASDLEPIVHLWKTQVRQLAEYLELPEQVLTKPPAAGLWPDQTDQGELGFSYDQADPVLATLEQYLSDNQLTVPQLTAAARQAFLAATPDADAATRILNQVLNQDFKHHVPYRIDPVF